MKKILVVLLILAVAGGVFAQGNWSLSGSAQVGTLFNFNPDLGDYLGVSGGSYKPWTGINGEFGADYQWGEGLSAGLSFNTRDPIFATLNGAGERYKFQVKTDLISLFKGDTTSMFSFGNSVDRLWGSYSMLNGMVTLEANYASADSNYWCGATTAHHVFRIDGGDVGTYDGVPAGNGFTDTDHNNYFVADFAFSGINFGILIPNVFIFGGATNFWNNPNDDLVGPVANADNTGWGVGTASWGGRTTHMDFVEDAFKRTIIGFKFDMQPISVAAQFNIYNFGAYIGASVGIGENVKAEFSFQGIFADPVTEKTTAVAAIGFGYDAGLFNADAKVGVYYDSEAEGLVIGVKPTFSFNIIPSHFAFNLEAGFWFGQEEFDWAFMPSFWWNFKGTGAGVGYYSGAVNTGIILRYTMWKDRFNCMDVVFRWNF